uniref:Bis(5'-nucleosyl)-tetraphosphatase [asymmetrical] n=1 Tax=Henneguya salminicola TaxID=69463 RepID=A0A6G3MLU4_HENSL
MSVSVGIVLFKRLNRESSAKFLILKASNGCFHWTPPKGHVELDEYELDTAFRELFEETEIKEDEIKLYKEFREVLEYNTVNGRKQSIYYLAELKDYGQEIRLSNEHCEYKWIEANKDLNIFLHTQTKELIILAEKYIKRNL